MTNKQQDKEQEYLNDAKDPTKLSECCGSMVIMGRCADCKEIA